MTIKAFRNNWFKPVFAMRAFIFVAFLAFVAVATGASFKVNKAFSLKQNERVIIEKLLAVLERWVCFFRFLFFLYFISNSGNAKQTTAQINEYVDKVMTGLDQYMVTHGLDPLHVPDIFEAFEYVSTIVILFFFCFNRFI